MLRSLPFHRPAHKQHIIEPEYPHSDLFIKRNSDAGCFQPRQATSLTIACGYPPRAKSSVVQNWSFVVRSIQHGGNINGFNGRPRSALLDCISFIQLSIPFPFARAWPVGSKTDYQLQHPCGLSSYLLRTFDLNRPRSNSPKLELQRLSKSKGTPAR